MPGNVVGEAWVAIRPDLSGFATQLTASLTAAMTKAQALVDLKPIRFATQIDTAAAVASVVDTGAAMNAAAVPITFTVQINSAEALAELAAIRAIASLSGAAGGGGIIPPVAGGTAAAGGAGNGGGGFLTGVAAQKVLGVGAGGSGLRLFGLGAGLAGSFSLLSFAGLGVEHVLTTILGLVGSLTGAIGGGLLLAIGAVGVAAVGMGADFAVMSSTIADTKTLYQGLTAVQTAILQYGKGSTQAASAQAALNTQIKLLGSTAGVAAELSLAKSLQALNGYWDKATSSARVAAVGLIKPFLSIADTYIPLVNKAATTNFTIMTAAFRPLIAWLNGPQGIGVFTQLETVFAKNLPTAIDAFTQGIELVLRSLGFLSSYTGGLTQKIDEFLRHANGPGWAAWTNIMQTLIGMFHTWFNFFDILTRDVVDFFKLTAGVGTAIVQALTGMLTRLHDWLNLTTTKTSLHNLFELHKQEVLELLAILPSLFSSLGTIYLTIAPLLTGAMVVVFGAIANVLKAITSNAWGAWLVGLTLIAAKLGIIGSLVKLLGTVPRLLLGTGTATSATSAATGFLGLGGGIQKVYVTNWAQIGGVSGAGGVEGAAGKGGLLTALGNLATSAGVAGEALAGAGGLAAALIGTVAILELLPRGPGQAKSPVAGAGGVSPTGDVARQQAAYAATWNALVDSANAAYRNSDQFQKNLQADLLAAGIPASKVAADAKIIAADFAAGKIKTATELQQLINSLEPAVAATHAIAAATGTWASLVGKSVVQIGAGFIAYENKLTAMGLSFGQAVAFTDLLQRTITKYGPLTDVQIQSVYEDWLHGASSAFDIALSLQTAAESLVSLPASASGIASILAYIHKHLPKTLNLPPGVNLLGALPHALGGFIAPGTWGTAGEQGIETLYGGRTGITVIPHNQTVQSEPGISITNHYHITGYTDASLVSRLNQTIRQSNMRTMRLMRAGARA